MSSRQSEAAGRPQPSNGSLDFEAMVIAEANGQAAPEHIEALQADQKRWVATLERLLDDTEDSLDSVRLIDGPERDQVVADFEDEWEMLIEALERLTGASYRPEPPPPPPVRTPPPAPAVQREANRESTREPIREINEAEIAGAGVRRLQLTWEPGRVVAWAGGPGIEAGPLAEVQELLAATGAPRSAWVEHPSVRLPRGERAEAVAAPVGQVLGWLVAIGADPGSHDVATSVRWLARLATIAVRHVAQGRMVPTLRQAKHARNKADGEESLSVRWIAALIDGDRLDELARAMPGSVAASEPAVEAATLTRSVLASMVDTVCREAAARVEVPAPPPEPETAMDVAEAFLARLDGARFDAPGRHATELVSRL
ncbi:MAG: Helicase, family, partial [Acidimicrobiia bacterium]|nr:Helicase, family [Acidimicrobiia bacterium]